MANKENLGWRDEMISARHRLYGDNCPACDLDWVLIEYDHCRPCGLVEYKHRNFNGRNVYRENANNRALKALADASDIPFWLAIYDPETWVFKVYPINHQAFEYFENGQFLKEEDYVRSLYAIRHREVPESVLESLKADSKMAGGGKDSN